MAFFPTLSRSQTQNSLDVASTTKAPSVDSVNAKLLLKQATLVSGATLKTVNGNSLLGSGDITIAGGGGGGATNLTYTSGAITGVINSDTGTDATIPQFTSSIAGLVPASGGGTTSFLRADGTFAIPAGGGGGASWGAITGTLATQTDLQAALNAKSDTSHTHSGFAPTGGATGYVLKKNSATNYDYSWAVDATAGGSTWGAITGTLSAQTDLQSALDAKATLLTPLTLSVNTSLTAAAHGNRTLRVDTPGVVLTINNDATGGWTSDDALDIQAVGAGTFTLVQGTATLTTDSGASADSTTAVAKRVQAQRLLAASTWRTVSSAIVAGGGGGSGDYNRVVNDLNNYLAPDDLAQNLIQTYAIGALAAGDSVKVRFALQMDAAAGAQDIYVWLAVNGGPLFAYYQWGNGLPGAIKVRAPLDFDVYSATTVFAISDQKDGDAEGNPFEPLQVVPNMASGCNLQVYTQKLTTGRVSRIRGVFVDVIKA